jgi:hypothetical protein
VRTLLLIDARCAPRLSDIVASVAARPSAHVTIVALPRFPALWRYAAPSGGTSPEEVRRLAEGEAQDVLRSVLSQLPLGYSVEHRVLSGWRDVISLVREGAFHVAVLAASPGRRARRTIAAASRTSGTTLVVA